MYRAFPVNNGASWDCDSGAVFDLNSNALRPPIRVGMIMIWIGWNRSREVILKLWGWRISWHR